MKKTVSAIFPYLFPRIRDAIFVGILLGVISHGPSLLNGDGDLGRHITIGNYILENWHVPVQDIFSHTRPGELIVPHEWIAQLGFAIVHSWMGLGGVVLLIAVLIAATFTIVYRDMTQKGIFQSLSFLLAGLAAYASSLHWLTRPHIFTFLFVAVWNHLLENARQRLWIFPLVMLLWANTHGAFVAGFLIWGAHLAGWLWEYLQGRDTKKAGVQLTLIGVFSAAVTLLNPVGWRLWETSLGYMGNRFLVDQTIEYQSPNFHNWSTWPFLVMIVLGILALGGRHQLRSHEAIVFAGWAALSLYSARNIPLFAILVAPYLGSMLQPAAESFTTLQRLEQRLARVENNLRGVFYPLLSIFVMFSMFYNRPITAYQYNPDKFPVKAVDWLIANPQDGKVFNNFIWGGYLLYRLWPEQVVFIDGQTDFYGEDLTREYTNVMSLAEGWDAILQKYSVSWVIVQSDKPLVGALQDKLGWHIVYQDGTATILHAP